MSSGREVLILYLIAETNPLLSSRPDLSSHLIMSLTERRRPRTPPEVSRAAWLAKNNLFDIFTLTIIVFNGLWMGIDTDTNLDEYSKPTADLASSEMTYIIMENFFCLYFTFEVLVRFVAFEKKLDARKDGWFKFDSFLVTLMILETWLVPILTYPWGEDPNQEAEGEGGGGGIRVVAG